MGHGLSLHQLTALDATPMEIARFAVDMGCDHVSLFTYVPERGRGIFACVTADDVAPIRDVLEEGGLSVCNIEVFSLDRDGDHDRYLPALRLGQALGATRATAQLYGTADAAHGIRRFRDFCAVAGDFGIVPGLEFHMRTDFNDVVRSARIVREAGCGALVIDALHVMRNGAQLDAIAANADLVSYAQLNDGPLLAPADRWEEAIHDRGVPGTGEFPLEEIVSALRHDIVIEVEVPQATARREGLDAGERCRRAVSAARAVLARVA